METPTETSTEINDNQDQQDNDKESRFNDGDKLTFVRVRFAGNARSQQFLLGKRTFTYGQKVVAMSDRGMTVGYINSFPYEIQFKKSMLPIRSIAKTASKEDIQEQVNYMQKEKDAEVLCKRLIEKHKLSMNVTHVEFIQFGKKSVFYFTAPERVDFRDLVKDLVGELRMRIELRQISVRDRAAALGAVGACGLQTCCSSFLTNYGNVSIKMAKNQNLALIPSKINGVCGQIKCCIKYEDDVYLAKRKLLPREGSYIVVKNKDIGRVTKLHLILEQFEMLTEKGNIRRYSRSQYDIKNSRPPKDWRFPAQFRSINNETSEVIGLDDEKEKAMHEYEAAIPADELDSVGHETIIDNDDSPEMEEVVFEKEKLDDDETTDEKAQDRKSQPNRSRSRNSRSPRDEKTPVPKNEVKAGAPKQATGDKETPVSDKPTSSNSKKKRYSRNKKPAPKKD